MIENLSEELIQNLQKQQAIIRFVKQFLKEKAILAETFPDISKPVEIKFHPDMRRYLGGVHSGIAKWPEDLAKEERNYFPPQAGASSPKPTRRRGRPKDSSRAAMIVQPIDYLKSVKVPQSKAFDIVRGSL